LGGLERTITKEEFVDKLSSYTPISQLLWAEAIFRDRNHTNENEESKVMTDPLKDISIVPNNKLDIPLDVIVTMEHWTYVFQFASGLM